MSGNLTRQQIYDRIRATSKDSYILEEMQRLGFWENSDVPTLSETLIRRETSANKELSDLMAKDRKYQNQEAMLREMRKERMKKAKENRELTKQKNKQIRLDKAARWKIAQTQQIIYLGKGISSGLNNTDTNEEKLQSYNLPVFASLTELAESMSLDLATLRYLLYQRKVSKNTHYYTFEIPKKSGGKRKISAPKGKMKNLQLWVLENILNQIPLGEFAHGFVPQRSILTNAQPHTGQDIVINVDLKDFFPTISYKRVKGLFRTLGYSEQMAIIFALICTQAETETVEMDGITYYVQKGERFLPQGSPASPAISNIIAYKLDKKIVGLTKKLSFNYTRYADDLSFSTTKENEQNIPKLICFLQRIIKSEGFTMHPDKTHIMRKGGLQTVTGIVVNEKLNIERKKLRQFRALLHNIEMNGWKDQKWGQADNLIHSVEGYIHFIQMVNPEKGIKFKEQLAKIIDKYGYPEIDESRFHIKANMQETVKPETESVVKEEKATIKPVEPENNDWWNIFS